MFNRLLAAVFGSLCSIALAGISVEPAYVDLTFQNGRASGQFVITNTGEKEERYRVVASHFTLTEGGTVQLADPDAHSMAAWIKFNPKEFSLPPNSKRVVRYVVLPKGQVESGQYWAAMELESLEGRDYSTQDGDGRTFNLKVIPTVLAPMFGKNGNINFDFEVTSMELKETARNKLVLEVSIQNKGTGVVSFRGLYQIVNSEGESVYQNTMDSGMLLRDRSRTYVTYIEPELPPGDYKLEIFYGSKATDKTIEKSLDLKIN